MNIIREPKRINPDHQPLQDTKAIREHVNGLILNDDMSGEGDGTFPTHVFPTQLQNVINATNDCLSFPKDFTGAAILYAVSIAIGNTHIVEIKKGWREKPLLYLAIVGKAGTNKSHPVNFALKPIESFDSKSFSKFQQEQAEYDSFRGLTKKEREENEYVELKKPAWKQHLVSDFTPEALAEVHKHNLRGIGVSVDELATWFKNFNRYNKGSEEQFWLSVWSGAPIRINRKSSEPVYIKSPFISVIGTIQPGILKELAADRTENGFLDRMLFVVPDNIQKNYWSTTELDRDITEDWNTILNRLLSLDVQIDKHGALMAETLRFEKDARQLLFDWQKQITDKANEGGSDLLTGIYAKMEMYAARLALCLEMLHYACGESNKQWVTIKSVRGAIELVDYFVKSALKVHTILSNTCPLDGINVLKSSVYSALPVHFKTAEGVKVAKDHGMPERTFKRMVKETELFKHSNHGEYEKKILK